MQIGKEQLAGTQQRTFGRLRFLDFDNQVGLLKRCGVIVHEFRAGLLVVAVRVAGGDACAALDNHLVAALDKLIGGGREQRDTILLVFDFLGNAYDHGARWTRVGATFRFCACIGTVSPLTRPSAPSPPRRGRGTG